MLGNFDEVGPDAVDRAAHLRSVDQTQGDRRPIARDGPQGERKVEPRGNGAL